jgi:apolipoprotein N-acyltransferase
MAVDDQIIFAGKPEAALALTTAYADAARTLAQKGARIVVESEKIGLLTRTNRAALNAPLSRATRETGAIIVVGYEESADEERNIALVFTPDGKVTSYYKRHMVPGLELLVPGTSSGFLGGGRAVAICKDMDFPRTIRADAQAHIRLMYVPAWDFGADAWLHSRMAIMRGVENGFALVRAAKDGLLTATDAEGRVLARMPSSKAGMVALVANVPQGPGDTLYLRIGDVFAWACLALFAGLTFTAILWPKSAPKW